MKKIKNFLLTIYPDHPSLKTQFPKNNTKKYFLSASTGKGKPAISTVSTITHYPFLSDLHILLFILHFFHASYAIFIRYQCFHRGNQHSQEAVKE